MKWKFDPLEPAGLKQRPRESEFFRETARPEAVVREAGQNILDAKRDDVDQVRMRIAIDRIKLKDGKDYLSGLFPHLEACGIMPQAWLAQAEVSLLTIEDFGTTGLTGPITHAESSRSEADRFVSFWLSEGESSKGGAKAGRWGLGKTTFHMASKISSFFGLTVRHDDCEELLMGKVLLKPHKVESQLYKYYGFFRGKDSMPIREENALRSFKETFPVARKSDQPGLSLVIPMPEPSIDYKSILSSTIINYFFPILQANLVVEIEDNHHGRSEVLDKKTLRGIASKTDWKGTKWENRDVERLLQFASKAINLSEDGDVVELNRRAGELLDISEESFNGNMDELERSFGDGRVMGFSIPLTLRLEEEQPKESHFQVFLQKCPIELDKSDELYIRSGITLPKERRRMGRRSVRGILIAEEKLISSFLASAEVPAHLKWNNRIEGFKERYENATNILGFVRHSMRKIADALRREEDQPYEDLLWDIFYISGPKRPPEDVELQEGGEEPGEEKGKDRTTEEEELELPPARSNFEIARIKGGFRVQWTGDDDDLPVRGTIKAAYDVQRGDPFANYEDFDFDFSGSGYPKVDSKECNIVRKEQNVIEFTATGDDFHIEVTGFDQDRDLAVTVG